MAVDSNKPLPIPVGVAIACGAADVDDDFVHEFTRSDLRELIHLITQELKLKGTKTPLLMLSFRPKIKDAELSKFLEMVIPTGKKLAKTLVIESAIKHADEFTLICALKYLWARLPKNSIIGWDAYESFKSLEKKENYPKKAFLEFMPQCLSSPSHASIVYDFLDLIVSIAANAKENQMSGRKISKMAGIWAFQNKSTENNFVDGLQNWLPSANAMFHLLLSFLRSMLPDDDTTKLQLPRTLHALLASNSYPPPDITYTSSTLVNVPLITIKTDKFSNSPIEMLNKVPKYLSLDDSTKFQAKEDFALLKFICKNDDNIINKLSDESKRILKMLNNSNNNNLKYGWPIQNQPNLPSNQINNNVEISRVPIDDYFIWAWLSSISFEQPILKKKIFGRSLILEVSFDGFKKWIIIEEVSLDCKLTNLLPEKPKVKKTIQSNYKSMLDDLPKDEKKSKTSKNKNKGLLKKFTENNGNRALPPPPPPVSETIPDPNLNNISLPEIEREQYRLSIPLEQFNIETSPQYKSLAPPSRDELYSKNIQNIQQYNYWSSNEPQQEPPYITNDYQDGYRDDYQGEYQQNYQQDYQAGYQDDYQYQEPINEQIPQQPIQQQQSYQYQQPDINYKSASSGSIENLNYMVDELSLQVNNVESKLDNNTLNVPKSRTSQIYEPVRSPKQAQNSPRPKLSPILTNEKPTPTPAFKNESRTNSNSANDPLASSGYATSSIYPPTAVDGDEDDFDADDFIQQKHTSMIEDVENYLANNNRETLFSENSYTTAKTDSKRFSTQSENSIKYPESIIDTYRQPSVYQSKNKDLSVEDINYIPEAKVENLNLIPIPSPPRSPLSKVNSPEFNEIDLPPPPPPKLSLQEVPQPKLDPPKEKSNLPDLPVVDSNIEESYYQTPPVSTPSIPKSQASTAITSKKLIRKSPNPSIDQKQYVRKGPATSPEQSTPSINRYSEQGTLSSNRYSELQQETPSSFNRSSDLQLQPSQQQQYNKSPEPQLQPSQPQWFNRRSPEPQLQPPEPQQLNRKSPDHQSLQVPLQAQHNRRSSDSNDHNYSQQSLDPNYPQQPTSQQHQQRPPSHQTQSYSQPHQPRQPQQRVSQDSRNGRPMNPNYVPNGPQSRNSSPNFNSRQNSPYKQQGYPPYMPPQNKRPSNPGSSNSSLSNQRRDGSPSTRGSPSPSRQGKSNYPPPPQGYYPPPQGYGYPPQGYYPPPQGYGQSYPPQGYPPQGYGYPPQGYPWYPPPPHGYYPPPANATVATATAAKTTASDVTLNSLPTGTAKSKLHHRPNNSDKKNIRNALVQGDFGI